MSRDPACGRVVGSRYAGGFIPTTEPGGNQPGEALDRTLMTLVVLLAGLAGAFWYFQNDMFRPAEVLAGIIDQTGGPRR